MGASGRAKRAAGGGILLGLFCVHRVLALHQPPNARAREGDEAVHPGLPDGLAERPFDAKVDGQQLAEFGEVLPEGSGQSRTDHATRQARRRLTR